ncbi:hypothetical protein [Pseudomonas cyclaminis]|uniref:hypothetical protein n=1 Tax=Pseudomonas cyclaminis TaxID=2781239 RepID=UPI00187E28E8|nr:hypothetical protein [Pseudomonas cyclaminis]MBE8598895.1 hypothetical protein [Pseudomonas cyclaminis]
MTTDAIMIEKTRKHFLTALDDTHCDTGVLQQIVEAVQQTPGVMEAYKVDGVTLAIDGDPVSWNPDYFSRQKVFAARNFSKERLEHLIQVRDVFRQRNEKGFTPTVAASPSRKAPMNNAPFDYQPSSNLKQFVDEGDLLTIRTALRLELNDRRLDGAELHAALAWIKGSVPGVFEAISEGAFAREPLADLNQWTEDYYDLQVTYLKTNFSEKRFLHLIDVREHLRNGAVEGFASTKTKASTAHSASPAAQAPRIHSHQTISDGASERNPAFKAALLIGGAIAAVVVFLIALVR